MRTRWYCYWGSATGFGRASRDYLAALADTDGIELEIGALAGSPITSPEPRYEELDDLVVPWDQVQGLADIAIYHAKPQLLAQLEPVTRTQARSGKRVALTTWETSPMPAQLAEPLKWFDGVIVPSEFVADLCHQAGIPYERLHLVPHCFDEDWWRLPTEDLRGAARTAREDAFRFYAIGAWGERKNMLGVLKAYLHAFTAYDKVQLWLQIDHNDFAAITRDIHSLIARSGLSQNELPGLFVPEDRLAEDQLLDLHATSDCFVSATRGEGFGLGMFEAAIMGRWIIAPFETGQVDFLENYEYALDVFGHRAPCFAGETRGAPKVVDGKTYETAIIDIPKGVTCKQTWFEPNITHIAQQMRELYAGRHDAAAPKDIARERSLLEARFGYRTVGPMLAQKLREIAYT
jgi:hypothetical protein